MGRHQKIDFTAEQLERVKDMKISGRKLEAEIGISSSVISRTRKELGLSFQRTKKVPVKRIVAIKKPKKEAMKANIKKLTPMKKSKMEEESIEMAKAKKAKEAFNKIETQRKAEGWRWESVTSEYGKKSMVFRKPIN